MRRTRACQISVKSTRSGREYRDHDAAANAGSRPAPGRDQQDRALREELDGGVRDHY